MSASLKPAAPDLQLSVLLPSLPGDFISQLQSLASLGFAYVDVVALVERPREHLDALAESGLLVACAFVGHGLPEGQTLDAESVAARRAALEVMKRHIADAARLGATTCYVVPGRDATEAGLARFREACQVLAGFAARRMARLCVKPVPGAALARADQTLEWLRTTRNDNLRLLLDVGHGLITGEDPARTIREAGLHLGYMHLSLLQGKLTETVLRNVLAACKSLGCVSLALDASSDPEDPESALRQGKALIDRLADDFTVFPTSPKR